MKKLLLTGAMTLFATSLLVGCGDTTPNNEPDESDFLDESEVEVEVFD
ncbi:hypothetical protein [Bacillus sp. FJAT-45350]|nr:hypothetical protein [Bacillus sp. FJAT-45350]